MCSILWMFPHHIILFMVFRLKCFFLHADVIILLKSIPVSGYTSYSNGRIFIRDECRLTFIVYLWTICMEVCWNGITIFDHLRCILFFECFHFILFPCRIVHGLSPKIFLFVCWCYHSSKGYTSLFLVAFHILKVVLLDLESGYRKPAIKL